MKLPESDSGYSVNPSTGTVHRRHPGPHAGSVMKARTPDAVAHHLNGRKPKTCRDCFPSQKKATSEPTVHPMRNGHPTDPLPDLPEGVEQG